MSETTKTLTFVLCAALALGAAWVGRPKTVGVELPDQVGSVLFPEFTDPYDAASMKVVQYDEQLGELREFEVAQKDGLWVIPSHQDYPADAEDNLSAAANLLVDLKVINVVGEEKSAHATYGVIRPDKEKLKVGDKGVGKLISFKDGNGNRLAELIVGAPVEGQANLRHVRVASIPRVYVVEIDPSKVSTKFEDWVQRDVLDLDGFDVRDISVRDYSMNPRMTSRGIELAEEPRLDMTAKWNPDLSDWELTDLQEMVGDKMAPTTLSDTEELDKESLNALKSTLDDLEIVDVERKPAGLGAGLKTEQNFWQDQEGIESLFERGFYAARTPEGQLLLRSSDGEVVVRTQDGVEYNLRFGKIASVAGNEDEDSGLNRFVMINASVDESIFEKPVLVMPEVEQGEAAEEMTDEQDGDSSEETPEDAAGDETEANGEDDASTAADSESEGEQSDDTESADSESDAAADEAAEGETSDEQGDPADDAAESTEADAEMAEEAEADESADDAGPSEEDEARVAAVKEYERQMDEYNEKLNAAQKKVNELNYRFSDWYYVISEKEYRKIHLSRSDVVKGKEATADEGFGIDAFRDLEDKGLTKEPATNGPTP